MTPPRIFVSHSHKDNAFTQRLVDDLYLAGAKVWVDKEDIQHGNFMERIDEALAQAEWMVLVLTPDAITSAYVRQETYTALHRVQQGLMRAVIPILAAPCPPASIPPQWDALHRYDAMQDYPLALEGVLGAIGIKHHASPKTLTQADVDLAVVEVDTRMDPENYRVWQRKAKILRRLGRVPEAMEAERRAKELRG